MSVDARRCGHARFCNKLRVTRIWRELAELTRAANRANATLYTIDPPWLVAGADLDQNVDPTEWANYMRKSQDSLRTLAELTAGSPW